MKEFFGKYRAIVTDNRDPELRGRVRARVPAVYGEKESGWALPCVPFAGKAVGFLALPPVGGEIWIEFEGGDISYPVWVGSLWDATEAPPETNEPPLEARFVVKTEGGLITIFGAAPETGGITIQTAGGQKIMLKDGPASLEILDNNGNSLRLNAAGVTITSPSKVTVNAAAVELSAGMVMVNSGMARFSGVVQADTVICNTVISQNYTPGAGNPV